MGRESRNPRAGAQAPRGPPDQGAAAAALIIDSLEFWLPV